MFYSNHGPISYRFLDKRRFQSKIAKIFPLSFAPLAEGVPLGIGYRRWESKKLEYRAEKEVDVIFSLVDTVHQVTNMTGGWTYRRTDTGRQQDRAYA